MISNGRRAKQEKNGGIGVVGWVKVVQRYGAA